MTTTQARTLEGGIQHLEVMPSIEDGFRKGQRLEANIFANLHSSNRWVRIPIWMAGQWLIRQETEVYRKNFKNGKSSRKPRKFKALQKFIYGMQIDRQGGIWHYVGVPYKSETRLSRFNEIHLVSKKDYIPYNQKLVEFKSNVKVLKVKRSSRKIDHSYQQESITSYKPLYDGTGDIKLTASTKTFDQNGNPLVQADNEARVRRAAKFSPVKQHKGKNMKKLFEEFLIATGRTNLLP